MPPIPYPERLGMHRALVRFLGTKFGEEGIALKHWIEEIQEANMLEEVCNAVVLADSIADIRERLPPKNLLRLYGKLQGKGYSLSFRGEGRGAFLFAEGTGKR